MAPLLGQPGLALRERICPHKIGLGYAHLEPKVVGEDGEGEDEEGEDEGEDDEGEDGEGKDEEGEDEDEGEM